jgi:hypothetical protein
MTGKAPDSVTLVYWYDLNRLRRGTQPDQSLAPPNHSGTAHSRFRGLDCAAGKGCVEPFLSRLGGYH